eukprot:GDKI01009470.1.p1 GENE.GDKI01009470.1~~GDKI01009470.1.p1  ORF type:complete len:141 (-),score=28.80 GDKI01009470.1:170-535(-)
MVSVAEAGAVSPIASPDYAEDTTGSKATKPSPKSVVVVVAPESVNDQSENGSGSGSHGGRVTAEEPRFDIALDAMRVDDVTVLQEGNTWAEDEWAAGNIDDTPDVDDPPPREPVSGRYMAR